MIKLRMLRGSAKRGNLRGAPRGEIRRRSDGFSAIGQAFKSTNVLRAHVHLVQGAPEVGNLIYYFALKIRGDDWIETYIVPKKRTKSVLKFDGYFF